MSKPDPAVRYIEPGSCSWCGHRPHGDDPCTNTIRTGSEGKKPTFAPCPCARRDSTAPGR